MPKSIAESAAAEVAAVPFELRGFSLQAACALIPCSESKLFELIAEGKIATFKIGRARKITGQAILEFRTRNAAPQKGGAS